MVAHNINRGDIFYVDFEPRSGHEQGEVRPAVIVSSDAMNTEVLELAIVIPSTRKARLDSKGRLVPNHLKVDPTPQNGLTDTSYFMGEQVRTISTDRISGKKIGRLTDAEMFELEDILIMLLDLGPK